MEKKRMTSFRFSKTELDYLDECSEFLGLNRTNTVRTIIRTFLRKTVHNEQVKANHYQKY